MARVIEALKSRITVVSDFVYVVEGNIICFKSGVYDLDSVKDLRDLIALGEDLYHGPRRRPRKCGKRTVCYVKKWTGTNELCVYDNLRVDQFPEEYWPALKEAMDYAAD